jgi:hypothetical protein
LYVHIIMTDCRTVSGAASGSSFTLPNVVIYTSNDTYVAPHDIDYLEVFAVGGGGGSAANGGGTGGSAGRVESGFYPGGTYAISVGTGGAGGAAGASGSSGNTSSFDGLLTANGGLPGFCPTAAGVFSGGLSGVINSTGFLGSSCGFAGNLNQGGNGGGSFFGEGGRATYSSTGNIAGLPGSGYGGGGAGGVNTSAGGAGADGAVIIIEHFI